MATKKHTDSQRIRRQRNRRTAKVVTRSWLLVLVAHTLATIVVLAVERLLNLPSR